MNNAGCTDTDSALGVNLLFKTIVATVCLICHHNDIPALRERLVRFLELLHRGKDNAVSLTSYQQLTEILPAGGLDGFLAEEGLALGELGIKLVIKIVTVRDNNNRGLIEDSLNQMGVEHHR